ncbi:MAG TPA: dienelactone hydrolase family protein, partial [Opitutaceae bacterium]|nr:dienelactone hydrolase family protein [Opitutaceae bacterium]
LLKGIVQTSDPAVGFFARLAEGVFDPAEVTRRTHALADFILAASAQHRLAPGRLIAIGFSNGANIAATLLQLRPETLAGAILLRPMVVLNQPATSGSLQGKNILISSGAHDPIVPSDHQAKLAALLEAGSATVARHTALAGHNLTSVDVVSARQFISRL